ncbi:hypothetical protein RND71_023761 [Anisodus tanguticus]|uniref:Thioredoxin domain-containing protein n=1 Tax=Anisodus tanguticus TaxID=243964 RepID=A0AAE1VBW4_9SOLA|nr:hypothetical protein RND71_023761 [Anisodus tanguticus]
MDANYSATLHESHNMSTTPQFKRSQVNAFHSSTKWKLHFDSLKDTNKLGKQRENDEGTSGEAAAVEEAVDAAIVITGAGRHYRRHSKTELAFELVVIDFTATWCGPCKYMEPVLNEFAAKYTDVEFVKIDVDELADVAQEYGVQAMPTFVLIKKGKVVDKIVGADKDGLKMKTEKHRSMFI